MALDAIDVIRRFEPILYFHRDERFFPSDAKRYLERCALWYVFGGPRNSKARWGGTSPSTFPHFPRIPRGKLVAAEGEAPVVPGSNDGLPGVFIGEKVDSAFPHLLDSADGERFLDLSGWIGGDAVDAASKNSFADLDGIAALYDGGDADLAASRFWYHAEVLSAARLAELLRKQGDFSDARAVNWRRLAKLTDPVLVCYYLFFPAHSEPLEGCPGELAARWGSFAGEWACVAVLLEGDGHQSNYKPKMIGLTARNTGTFAFLGQEPRVGMQVMDWSLVTKVVRPRPGALDGEHPRVFVSLGTHGLYPNQLAQPAPRFSPDDFSGLSCGNAETFAAHAAPIRAEQEEREADERLMLGKVIAAAALGASGGSFLGPGGAIAGAIGAGIVGGIFANMAEFGMAGIAGLREPDPAPAPPQFDHPPGPGQIGTVIHPRGVDPPDAPPGQRKEWPRLNPANLDDERTLTTTIAGRAYSLWVASAAAPNSRPIWLPSDDPATPSFRGRWGNRVVDDPFSRRAGMRFPEFWFMFINGLGKG